MRLTFLLVLLLGLSRPAPAQTKPAELLLVGTFHFHNPGADVAKFKTLDILAPTAQAELEKLAASIARFGPRQIFVEWPQAEQAELDTVYRHYLRGPASYEAFVKATYKPGQYGFYLKNEIVQLAFRTGKKAGLTRIYGLDYNGTAFPFDSVKHAMQAAHQDALLRQTSEAIKAFETDFNTKADTYTLTQLLLDNNEPATLAANKALYLNILNRAGSIGDFAGAYLVAEWYRRNLYMYSILQKTVAPADNRVMVLVGAGHAAMLRDFVPYDRAFRLVPLAEVLRK